MECAITVGLPVKLRCILQPCCTGSCALMNVVVNENSVLLVKIPAIERCPEHVFLCIRYSRSLLHAQIIVYSAILIIFCVFILCYFRCKSQ